MKDESEPHYFEQLKRDTGDFGVCGGGRWLVGGPVGGRVWLLAKVIFYQDLTKGTKRRQLL